MTPSATNSRAAEVIINHVSAKTLNTGRMTPSATNSKAAEVLINHVSAETLNTSSIQCVSTDMVY
jgi:methylglyoxal synthase